MQHGLPEPTLQQHAARTGPNPITAGDVKIGPNGGLSASSPDRPSTDHQQLTPPTCTITRDDASSMT
eukprot:scaffold3800_cov137-Pinguiococcus_pyrenoidosus.AAC.5